MCPVPESSINSLNKIGYLHKLNGNQMSNIIPQSILSIDSGLNVPFKVEADSMVIAYAQVPEGVKVSLSVQRNGAM